MLKTNLILKWGQVKKVGMANDTKHLNFGMANNKNYGGKQ